MASSSAILICLVCIAPCASITITKVNETKSASSAFPGNFIVYAHGANTKQLVNWAMEQGANGVELDIEWGPMSGGGMFGPKNIKHQSKLCDCSVRWKAWTTSNICSQLGSCDDATDFIKMMEHLAGSFSSKLASIYFDTKTDEMVRKSNAERGNAAVSFVDRVKKYLFDKGYTGKIVVSGGSRVGVYFLTEARTLFDTYPTLVGKVAYTYDRMELSEATIELKEFRYRLFTRGITAGIPKSFYGEVKRAGGQLDYWSHGSIVWTIDLSSTAQQYVEFGARQVITNTPATIIRAIRGISEEYILEKPGSDWKDQKLADFPDDISNEWTIHDDMWLVIILSVLALCYWQ